MIKFPDLLIITIYSIDKKKALFCNSIFVSQTKPVQICGLLSKRSVSIPSVRVSVAIQEAVQQTKILLLTEQRLQLLMKQTNIPENKI